MSNGGKQDGVRFVGFIKNFASALTFDRDGAAIRDVRIVIAAELSDDQLRSIAMLQRKGNSIVEMSSESLSLFGDSNRQGFVSSIERELTNAATGDTDESSDDGTTQNDLRV